MANKKNKPRFLWICLIGIVFVVSLCATMPPGAVPVPPFELDRYSDMAALETTFLTHFDAGYHVIALAEQYRYALVAGKDLDYLRIMARKLKIPEDVRVAFLEKAEGLGYDTDRLVWVKH